MFHGHLVISAADLDNHSVVLKPSIGLRLTIELTDSVANLKLGGITAALMALLKHSGPETCTRLLVGTSMSLPSLWALFRSTKP